MSAATTPPRIPGQHAQFPRFVLASGLSVPVNLGSRLLFSRVVDFEVAIVLSHICGMLTAYALNRLFVFAPTGRSWASELSRFALVNVFSALQTWVVAVGLLRIVFPWIGWHHAPELVAHLTALATSAVTSFFGHRLFSFARS